VAVVACVVDVAGIVVSGVGGVVGGEGLEVVDGGTDVVAPGLPVVGPPPPDSPPQAMKMTNIAAVRNCSERRAIETLSPKTENTDRAASRLGA